MEPEDNAAPDARIRPIGLDLGDGGSGGSSRHRFSPSSSRPSARQPAEPNCGPAGTSAASYRIAVGILLVAITYGSLYPFTWNFVQPQDFIYIGPIGVIDLVENIVLFLPLGWLLAWHYDGGQRQWKHFWTWFVIALVVASVLQWLQKYLPRTPAASDIVFNMAGHVAGWWAGRLSARALNGVMQRHPDLRTADRFAILMLAIWVIAELFPLIPTFNVSSVYDNVKSLWQQDPWQPRRMGAHVGMTLIGLEALAQLLRSASVGRLVRPLAVLVTLCMRAGKFVVLGQSPGLAVVFGIAGGAILWLFTDFMPERLRLMVVLLIAVASYLVYALAPYEFQDFPTAMHWLPFASSLKGSIEAVVTSVAFEALCFGAIIWSAMRMGWALVSVTLCVAALAFGCEWSQRYLPGRTAEISSVLTALVMGWLLAALGHAGMRRKKKVYSHRHHKA